MKILRPWKTMKSFFLTPLFKTTVYRLIKFNQRKENSVLSVLYQHSITQNILPRNNYIKNSYIKQLIFKVKCKKCEQSIKILILSLNQNIL